MTDLNIEMFFMHLETGAVILERFPEMCNGKKKLAFQFDEDNLFEY